MTFQKFGLLCGAGAALLAPGAASAQTTAQTGAQSSQPFALVQPAPTGATAHVDADARCLAASMVMSGAADPQLKNIGPPATIYYYGRIEGHGGRAGLESRLAAQFEAFKTTPQIIGPSVQSCAQMFVTRGAAFKTVAAQMAKRYGSAPPSSKTPPPAH
jgi:hypothetical protein